jgi:phosphate uptake regulator
MKRKVIKQGNNTLTLTLPRTWCETLNIKAGDELDVDAQPAKLVVQANANPEHREAEIEIPKGTKGHRRFIVGPYTKGYDVIRIKFHDADALPRILEGASLLIGFEITKQSENLCVLTNIAKGLDTEFESMKSRLMSVAIDMLDSTIDAIEKKEYERLKSIKEMETLANRLNLFCRRMVNTMPFEQSAATRLNKIICQLEDITDQVSDICEIVENDKMKVAPVIIEALRTNSKHLKLVRAMLTKSDMQSYNTLAEGDRQLNLDIYRISRKVPTSNVPLMLPLYAIKEDLHNIAEELN